LEAIRWAVKDILVLIVTDQLSIKEDALPAIRKLKKEKAHRTENIDFL